MVLKYIRDIVFSIYNKLFIRPFYKSTYNSFADKEVIDIITTDPQFEIYKQDNIKIKNTLFALNSLPEVVHKTIFKENESVCSKYFQMYYGLNDKNEFYKKYDNLETLEDYLRDDNLRYYYVRVNLVESKKNTDHANLVMIDKLKKYIMYFEPQFEMRLSLESVSIEFSKYEQLNDFEILIPKDIGYSHFNKLQRFDNYCQTYVLYAFCLVVNNPKVDYKDYSDMFNSVIIKNNGISSFLFYIFNLLAYAGVNLNQYEQIVGELEEVDEVVDADGVVVV